MREIEIQAVPIERLAALLSDDRAKRFMDLADLAREQFAGRSVWNVNATSKGGGVAELLQTLLAYGRGAQINTRWLVLDGDDEFFLITKRLHNFLHDSAGDGGGLGEAERAHFEAVLALNEGGLVDRVKPGDMVILHDPQTAALVDGLRAAGAQVIWRCHVGTDETTETTTRGWDFLRPYVERADAFVFSRREYAPAWVPADRLAIIAPSIDPFSAKNVDLTAEQTRAALSQVGLVRTDLQPAALRFVRRDGSSGTVRRHRGLVLDGGPIPGQARLVMQISRWDRLKDMPGVLKGFADNLKWFPPDVHLALVGPDTGGVSDDPEGAEVLAECRASWWRLPAAARARIRLISLPMDDVDENAHLVNALHEHAHVVVQKSLAEGFGLTVTEAMWKARPVIASAVGGIKDQIVDDVHGLLLADPLDLNAYARALQRVLTDDQLADRLGQGARSRVQDRFLGDRHLVQYVELFASLAPAEQVSAKQY